jgi:uncharacterized membrane protein
MASLWFRKVAVIASAAIVGVTGAAVVAQASPTALNWGPVSTGSVPPARQFAAMSFDSTRNRTVLFGGGNSAFVNLSDTWEFDGSNWIQRTPTTSPPGLVGSAMAYDANRHVSVLFGGGTQSGSSAATWEWDGTNWTLRTFATAPSARLWTTMAYDSARGRIVLFGGSGSGGTDQGDTWEYDGSTWTRATPANSPSPRYAAAMAYDPGLARVVLFGGRVAGQRVADTWEWDGTNWTQFTPSSAPFPRQFHSMAFDSQVGHVVVFGGDHIEPFSLGPINDTWEWDGSQWTQDWTSAAPSARIGQTMALDPNGRIVLFGGSDEGNPGVFPTDTQELGTGIVTPAGNPAITFNPTSEEFGNVDVGTTTPASNIRVLSSGTGPVLATISTTGDFAISSSNCPSAPNPLAAGMFCRLDVTFTPTAGGDRFGSLVFTGNLAGGSQSVPLHGFGVCCDFGISANPTNTSATQGSSITAAISTTVIGAQGTVALSFTSTDAGLTATFSPSSITSGGGSTMTIVVGPAVPIGLQGINAVGTEGPVFHSVEVFVNVRAAPPDFSIAATPGNLTIVQGTSGTSTISTAQVTGAAGTVNLGVASSPAGLAAILNPTAVTAGGSSTLTVSPSLTTMTGTYTLTVTGTEGSVTHSASVTVTVAPVPPNDFSISASPTSLTVVQGAGATSAVSTAVTSGSAEAVSLSASSPAGLTATLSPSSVTAGGGSTLTVTASATVAPGAYTVTVTGVATSNTHSVSVTVNVTAAPSDFSISATPSSLTVVQGNSGNSTISTALVTGTADSISLSAVSSPSGLTATLNPAAVNAGAASMLTVSPDFTTAPGTYVVTVTGTESSGATHSASVTVTITAGPRDFSISASPSTLSIVQGSSVTSSISTAVIGGPGTIALSASSSAPGVSATLAPASISAGGSSTLTVSAAYTTSPGSYTVTVTGTEGSNTHSTVITVTVTAKGIVNGGFETGDFTGWTRTGVTTIVKTPHSGVFAARIGSTSPSAKSTLAQTFTVPAAGGKLTFWYRMTCTDNVKSDWFTVTVHDGVTGATSTLLAPVCPKTAVWTKVTVNLSAHAGHSVTVTFVNHDDGQVGDPSHTLLDDVALI